MLTDKSCIKCLSILLTTSINVGVKMKNFLKMVNFPQEFGILVAYRQGNHSWGLWLIKRKENCPKIYLLWFLLMEMYYPILHGVLTLLRIVSSTIKSRKMARVECWKNGSLRWQRELLTLKFHQKFKSLTQLSRFKDNKLRSKLKLWCRINLFKLLCNHKVQ